MFRTIARGLIKRQSSKAWRQVLADPEFPQEFRAPAEQLLVPENVHCGLFLNNLQFLMQGGAGLGTPHLSPTPSVAEFASIIERPPLFPLWFFAAFPDVASWIAALSGEAMRDPNGPEATKLESLVKQSNVEDLEQLKAPDGSCSVLYAKQMVAGFQSEFNRRPECCL